MKKFDFSNLEIQKFSGLWDSTIPVINELEKINEGELSDEKKVIVGLTKRCLNIYKSINILNNQSNLESSLILGRSLFDTEILIDWLLVDNNQRIRLYLDGIDLDKDKL